MSNRLLYKSVAGPDLANSVSNYLQANKALASGFTGLGNVAATLDKNRADAANAALLRGLIKQESFADAQNYLNAAGTQQDLAYATAAYLDKAMNYKQGMPEVDRQVFNNRIANEYAQNGDLVSRAFQAYSRGDVASYNAQLEEARRRGLSSQVIDKIKYEVETNRGRRITNDTNAYALHRKQRYDRITDIATPHVNHILAQRARGLVIDPQKYYDEHRDELQQLSFEDFNNTYLKIINTGTIGRFAPRWGYQEMKYLKDKYLYPVVDKAQFLEYFPNSYGEKSLKRKNQSIF